MQLNVVRQCMMYSLALRARYVQHVIYLKQYIQNCTRLQRYLRTFEMSLAVLFLDQVTVV